jgi:hypothetical protein
MLVFSEQGEGRGVGNELSSGKTETMYVVNFDNFCYALWRKVTFYLALELCLVTFVQWDDVRSEDGRLLGY